MANNVVITDSVVVVFGTALNNTQTDNFFNFGTGNTIVGEGGNINVIGLTTDSNTAVILNSTTGAITGVTDNFTLDGNTNSLTDSTATSGSTINFTVNGGGGANTVDVTNASTSTITVSATGPAGGNSVTIDNAGGTNTVSLGGLVNAVTLNGDATNTATFTAGSATVTIGSSDDNLFGNASTVTFAGTGKCHRARKIGRAHV